MAYLTKELSFSNALAHLKVLNTFAFKMFCRLELLGDLEYEKFLSAEQYGDSNLPELNRSMLSRMRVFLAKVDEELCEEVLGLAAYSAIHREVLEHFEQDESL